MSGLLKWDMLQIDESTLEKIKNLDYRKEPHIGFDKTVYPEACHNQNQHYNTGHAINEGIDWSWTDIFLPKDWTDVGLAFDRADPGYIIPWHTDHFANYSKRFGHLRTKVKRRMVFLEDWKTGHYFQLENDVYTYWRQGEYVEWSSEQAHMGANVGPEPRYTLQITGVPNESSIT